MAQNSNETLKDNIDNFQNWYDKAEECKYALQDLEDKLGDIVKTKFDNINDEFSSQLEIIEHENKLYTCRCGSGFNKEEIVKYWNNQELLLNKIVTIRYYGISQDSKTGLYALRLPRWIHRIREDKNEISMY